MIINPLELAIGIVFIISVGFISLKIKIIDITGFLAATFVGFLILWFGGISWFLILLSFHLITGFFTRYKYNKKMEMETAEAKEGARGWPNILSNSVVASILAVGYGLTSNSLFAAGYLGALSTSIADTLATEIGLLSPNEPRLITNLVTKVKPGTSGGVTLLGEVSGLFGSTLTALVTLSVSFEGLNILQILISNLLIGFLGCNFDSLLGATIQVTLKCQVCGKLTEKKLHCKRPTEYFKGIRIIDNNVINLTSTLFGALIAILLFIYTSI